MHEATGILIETSVKNQIGTIAERPADAEFPEQQSD